jgi:hypothetical protein
MSFPELVSAVKILPRADKLRLMQVLVIDLARDEGVPLLTADAEYPVWTPFNAFSAAETLFKLLEAHQAAA